MTAPAAEPIPEVANLTRPYGGLVGLVLFISIIALPQGLISEIRSAALVRKVIGRVRESARQFGCR